MKEEKKAVINTYCKVRPTTKIMRNNHENNVDQLDDDADDDEIEITCIIGGWCLLSNNNRVQPFHFNCQLTH